MQPEGLQESSPWSEGSGDHRYRVNWNTHPETVLDIPHESLAPYRVLSKTSTRFRWSSLRGDHRLLSRSPSGWLSAKSTKLMLPKREKKKNLWL